MKPRIVSRFDMLPIRWRLAVTSAILTFVILLAFALVIAFFTERQMVSDFNDDVRDNATRIQQRLQEQVETTVSGYRIDARDELLEFAEVHGNHYGTPREAVEQALAAGQDVMFDIDWQGTRQVCEKLRDDVVSVFILPPSMRELKARLERRAEDSDDVIARRLDNARQEIAQWGNYDYVLVNDDLQTTFDNLKAILAAERLRRSRQAGMERFVEALLQERV